MMLLGKNLQKQQVTSGTLILLLRKLVKRIGREKRIKIRIKYPILSFMSEINRLARIECRLRCSRTSKGKNRRYKTRFIDKLRIVKLI